MINNIDTIIREKAPWPPDDRDERQRQEEFHKSELLYNDCHGDKELFPQISEYLKDQKEDKQKIQIIMSTPRDATGKHISLLLGEAPTIQVPTNQTIIDDLLARGLLRTAEECIIDVARYGVGILQAGLDSNENPLILVVNPRKWIPITEPGNVRSITHHVIYDIFEEVRKINTRDEKVKCVRFTIHTPGFVQHRIFDLKDKKLAEEWEIPDVAALLNITLDSEGRQKTGVDLPLVVVVNNQMTSEMWYGRTDYGKNVRSLVESLEMSLMSRHLALSKFTQPTPYGPDSMFEPDFSAEGEGRMIFDPHKAIMLNPEDEKPGALTWDISAEAQAGQIEELFHHLLDALDISMELMAGREGAGVLSGTALKLKLIPTRARVSRYQTYLDHALKHVITLAYALKNQTIKPTDVEITWRDGLPRDEKEDSEIVRNLSTAQAISTERKVRMFEVDDEADEVGRIKQEKQEELGGMM